MIVSRKSHALQFAGYPCLIILLVWKEEIVVVLLGNAGKNQSR